MVKNHRGMGFLYSDRVLEFCDFNTFVGDVKLRGGKFYYEAEVASKLQMAWRLKTSTQSGYLMD
jgi:hypothetical protein